MVGSPEGRALEPDVLRDVVVVSTRVSSLLLGGGGDRVGGSPESSVASDSPKSGRTLRRSTSTTTSRRSCYACARRQRRRRWRRAWAPSTTPRRSCARARWRGSSQKEESLLVWGLADARGGPSGAPLSTWARRSRRQTARPLAPELRRGRRCPGSRRPQASPRCLIIIIIFMTIIVIIIILILIIMAPIRAGTTSFTSRA